MQHKNDVEALVHLYEDGWFSRRELMKRLTRVTGSAAVAAATIESLQLPAEAQTAACPADVRVPEDAPDIETAPVDFPGQAGTLFGYWTRTRPMPENPMAAIVVIHENAGLSPYIKDVTRRIARAGFVGVAIDLLSRQGGTARFPDPVDAMAAYNRTQPDERIADLVSTISWTKSLDYVAPGRMGVIGFCAGGGNLTSLLVNTSDLGAGVAFYPGSMPTLQDINDKLSTPVLFNVAELDTAVTSRVIGVVPTLLTARKKFSLHVYDGTNHAFHNDTGPRYDPAAACDAWNLSLAFLRKFLPARV